MNALLDLLDMNREASNLYDGFRSYGYLVTAEPISGEEAQFVQSLKDGFAKVESAVSFNASRYGYRGKSKAALAALHAALPDPCWLVELM